MRAIPVNLRRVLRAPLALALIAVPAGARAADYYGSGWYTEASLSESYDDNIGRAGAASDIESDFITGLDAGLGHLWIVGDNSRASLAGRVAYDRFNRFGDLSTLEAGVEADYVVQPYPGFSAPWVELTARVAWIAPDDSAIRRGALAEAGVRVGRRITDAVVAQIGYRYTARRAEGPVFDTDSHALTLDLDASLSSAMSAYATYEFRDGDVVSTASLIPRIEAAARAYVRDDAFGRVADAGGYYDWRWAYRLIGRTHALTAGFQYDVAQRATIDLSGSWFDTNWRGGGSYYGVTLGAALLLRY